MKILLLLLFLYSLTSAAPNKSGEETIAEENSDFVESLADDTEDLIIIRPALHIPGFNLASEAGIEGFPFQFPGLSVPQIKTSGDTVQLLGSQLAFTGVDLRDVFGGGGTRTGGGETCDTLCQFLEVVKEQVNKRKETIEDIRDKGNEVAGEREATGQFDVNNSTYSQQVLLDGTVVHKNSTLVTGSDEDGNGFIFSTSLIHNLPSQQDLDHRASSSNATQDVESILNRSERNAPSSRLRLLPSSAPPNLEDDILVNYLLGEDEKRGGLRRLEPNTELVMEDPPGSGHVIPLSGGAISPFQQENSPFQQENSPFQQENNPFQQEKNPFQQENSSLAQENNPL